MQGEGIFLPEDLKFEGASPKTKPLLVELLFAARLIDHQLVKLRRRAERSQFLVLH